MYDYYTLLETESSAGSDEIKANYRRLAMHWHPDRNPGSGEAEEKFKLISQAYAVLSDPQKRAAYDRERQGFRPAGYGAAGYGPGSGPGRSANPFGDAFGAAGYGAPDSSTEGFARNPFGFGFAFTARDAEDLFSREMHALALELSLQNIPWQEIAQALEARGCPPEVARRIARKMEEERKAWVRASAKPWFVRSAVSAFFGFSLFGLFWGVGFGLLGLMGFVMLLSGGWNLARALYAMATGNAPQRAV